MRRELLLLAASLFTFGCATRRPPVVEQWTAVLVDQGGFSVVHTQRMPAPLYPVLTYRDCPDGPIVRAAAGERSCSGLDARRRVFLLFYTDTKRRAALYREEGLWSSD